MIDYPGSAAPSEGPGSPRKARTTGSEGRQPQECLSLIWGAVPAPADLGQRGPSAAALWAPCSRGGGSAFRVHRKQALDGVAQLRTLGPQSHLASQEDSVLQSALSLKMESHRPRHGIGGVTNAVNLLGRSGPFE